MVTVEKLVEEDCQGKPKYSEKTCPSVTLSTTDPTWADAGSNPGRLSRKSASNRLSYGATSVSTVTSVLGEMYHRHFPSSQNDASLCQFLRYGLTCYAILPPKPRKNYTERLDGYNASVLQ
jgi:hypothetical protein